MSKVCAEFHCTPSQARLEAAEDVLEITNLRRYAEAKALVEHPDFDEEMLEQAGVSRAAVDLVFEIMETVRG